MHYPQTWLLAVLSLSSYVSAFYPYNRDNNGKSQRAEKRFYPIAQAAQSRNGVVKVDVHKVPVQKRDNQFSVVLSNPATSGPNALAIHQDGSDYSYFSTFRFGSQGQEMFMLIDTGSANTWVFSSDCLSETCSIHNTFGKEDSTTLKTTTNTWDLAYGTGAVSGIVGSDTVKFANFSINLGFGLATNASSDFDGYPMDGILGLGRRSSGNLGTPTIMDVLDDQANLAQNVVGVHLHRAADGSKDGEILFGGIDTAKFAGTLAYTKTANDNSWEIPVDDILVGGAPCSFTDRTAIIDTGTSFILLPPADAQAMHKLIPGSAASGESFTVPCNTGANLEVKINGKLYQISPRDYVGKPVQGSTTICGSNIVGHQAFGPKQWILGDVFLKNVYAVFDFDGKQIGFGFPSSGGSISASSSSNATSGTISSSTTATVSASTSNSRSSASTSNGAQPSSTQSTDSTLGQSASTGGGQKTVIEPWKIAFLIALAFVIGCIDV
ncbi:hypothetical protein LTR64_006936 [Lithohypha guttulata]|uniref:uncharacterized protein n=1 Tax=Lithohypha guttulata TaxID=1690604 RepID=UPI002DDDC81E|nr:hypothetical protein LTR51_004507 [Lithohypha guttulata]